MDERTHSLHTLLALLKEGGLVGDTGFAELVDADANLGDSWVGSGGEEVGVGVDRQWVLWGRRWMKAAVLN